MTISEGEENGICVGFNGGLILMPLNCASKQTCSSDASRRWEKGKLVLQFVLFPDIAWSNQLSRVADPLMLSKQRNNQSTPQIRPPKIVQIKEEYLFPDIVWGEIVNNILKWIIIVVVWGNKRWQQQQQHSLLSCLLLPSGRSKQHLSLSVFYYSTMFRWVCPFISVLKMGVTVVGDGQ